MPQSKILVDTNVYLRLAQSMHPLLKTPFGKKKYTLYILPDLVQEYFNNPRLTHSHPWFNNDEYIENRKCRLNISNENRIKIDEAYKFIRDASIELAPGISRVDIKCLSHGYILGIPVATDDSEMIILAKEFDIKTYRMVDILKLMFDCKHIDMEKIREIALYLVYLPDLPANFRNDYKSIFLEDICQEY